MPGSFSDFFENKLLDDVLRAVAHGLPVNVHVALFTAPPTDAGGGTEVSGNGYARVALARAVGSWAAPASGATGNAVAIAFPTPTPAGWGTIVAMGLFDAATLGNLIAWADLAGPIKNFTVAAATDTFTSSAHGFVDGQAVRVDALPGLSLPTGIVAGTTYFIRDSLANSFKLAATSGGVAIDITTDGAGVIFAWLAKVVNAGDPVSFPIGQLTMSQT